MKKISNQGVLVKRAIPHAAVPNAAELNGFAGSCQGKIVFLKSKYTENIAPPQSLWYAMQS
jgi:hypothetical protein